MDITPAQLHQQNAATIRAATDLHSRIYSSAPNSTLAKTVRHDVDTLKSMVAAGKSQASIDLHLKQMNKTITNARREAYNTHAAPQPGHYAPAQPDRYHGYGQPAQGNAGHYQAATHQTGSLPTQNAGHFAQGPSTHALDHAQVALRNMSRIGHNGNALF